MSGKYMRAVALVPVLVLSVTGTLFARTEDAEATKCVDRAYAYYNYCLMGARSEWHRVLCDIEFDVDILACAAQGS